MPKKADGIQFQDPQQTLLVKHIMDDNLAELVQRTRLGIRRGHRGNR
jgi:hypothetical protein